MHYDEKKKKKKKLDECTNTAARSSGGPGSCKTFWPETETTGPAAPGSWPFPDLAPATRAALAPEISTPQPSGGQPHPAAARVHGRFQIWQALAWLLDIIARM